MLDTIKKAVEKVTDLKIDKNTRQREYVVARCLYFHFARELTGKPFAEIGQSTGHHHSSVLHALKSFDVHYKYSDFFKQSYQALALILQPTKSKEAIDEEHISLDEAKDKIKTLVKVNIKLHAEIKELKNNLPDFDKYFNGIPQERVQFFINNQMSAFLNMERATIKKQQSYERENSKIRETKQTAIQADFEETGIRVRNKAYKSSLPS